MTDDWTLLRSDKDVGSWKPKAGSKYTLEEYVITTGGTWVPTVDVPWLLTFKYVCPCKLSAPPGQRKRIKMFAILGGTARQHHAKPDRPPRMRDRELSTFGLVRSTGG